MLKFVLKRTLGLAAFALALISAQAHQHKLLLEWVEALQAGIDLGQAAFDDKPITREHVARVRKELNEALDALEPLLPP